MDHLIWLIIQALNIYLWLIIFTVVISWLVAFDVLNTRNKWVYKFCDILNRLTNPLIVRLRRVIPPLGGMDITPMIVIFGIYLLQGFLISLSRSL